jgi:hypothetical protein
MSPEEALAKLKYYYDDYGYWVYTVSAEGARARALDYRQDAAQLPVGDRVLKLLVKACAFEAIAACIDVCGPMRPPVPVRRPTYTPGPLILDPRKLEPGEFERDLLDVVLAQIRIEMRACDKSPAGRATYQILQQLHALPGTYGYRPRPSSVDRPTALPHRACDGVTFHV